MKTKQRAKRRIGSVDPLECEGNCSSNQGSRPYNIDIELKPVLSNMRTIEPPVKSDRVAADDLKGSYSSVQKKDADTVSLCALFNVICESGHPNIMLSHHPCQPQCATEKAKGNHDITNAIS